ncbi:30S ribosomal protein S1 [Polystyrenella longa]|uniref:30S ribosomal protein S1 n=1 Tax=Polystyrenella longa TaxID=2528007 RepID=A0A518CU59_9PLAN|nr:S1 RNA-binding domain-containing protein [Polystyrenella longa]QDU82757.1 30S ribosomal protein S1 [Polystyrenella longa]
MTSNESVTPDQNTSADTEQQKQTVQPETSATEESTSSEKAPLAERMKRNQPQEMKAVGTQPAPEVSSAPEQTQSQEQSSTPAAEQSAPTSEVAETPAVEPAAEATAEATTAMEATTNPETAISEVNTSAVNSEAILEQMKEASAPKPKAAKVDIPKADDLDADIDAQLEAAMAGEMASGDLAATAASNSDADPVKISEAEVGEGDRLKGKVDSINGDDVFIELGLRSSGVLSLRQFPKGPPEVGSEISVRVAKVDPNEGLIHLNLSGGRQKVGGDWSAVDVGQVVDAMVTKTVKGGLEVSVSNLRAFMPAGQVDIGFISDLEPFVGQKVTAVVLEVNPKKRNLVVSRRQYLQAQREEEQGEIWGTLAVGQQHQGKVKTIKNYGAFVDLGSIDGFLHVGEISWMRINHPSDVLKEGQEVEVQIISIDEEKKRIGLGMKQLVQNPWTTAETKYEKGNSVSGKVTRTTDFGAFVELEQGVEGLIHISELDHKRVNKVTDVLKEGQQVDVQILEVDQKKHRIGLSLKALIAKPESAKDEPEEDVTPYVRKRKEPLQGGTGNTGGSGLFGNPTDFT